MTNRQIRLRSRPEGAPSPANFETVDSEVPEIAEGEVLRRTIYLSLDPYMRGRMSAAPSYAQPVAVGAVMCGHTVSRVVESRNPDFRPGELVVAYDGWQQYGASDGKDLRKIPPGLRRISAAIGVLGMPGLTAYVGLMDIGKPQPGETVVVSAASGAVGSVAGQLAKMKGCRVVGIAGAAEKCRYVVDELRFDACVSHTSPKLVDELRDACPVGADVYFENVGGPVTSAVFKIINRGARIPLCGLIADYNAPELPPGPNLRPVLVNRATITGFIISDHNDRWPAFLAACAPLVDSGRLRYREDIVGGLDAAPETLVGLLEGRNFGKVIVRVADE